MMGDEVVLDRETHVYRVNGVEVDLCVSDVLALSGITKPYPPEAAQRVEHARLLGECVHAWCEHIDNGGDRDPCLKDTEADPLVSAYENFRLDSEVEWGHIEDSFYREGVCGTPDRIGIANGTNVILDIKTQRLPAAHWGIQLTAYQWLSEYSDSKLWVCWLGRDGTYRVLNYTPEPDVWKAALTLAKWQRR